jgi:hypothetical protein
MLYEQLLNLTEYAHDSKRGWRDRRLNFTIPGLGV